MIEKDISCHRSYEYGAYVIAGKKNEKLQGTLKFSNGAPPSFRTNTNFDISSKEVDFLRDNKEVITCVTDIESFRFILLNSRFSYNVIYPESLIKGDKIGQILSVEILLNGFSTWINPKRKLEFEVSDDEDIKNLHDCKISEEVNINSRRYLIESNLCLETKRVEKQDCLITEYTTITVKSLNGFIKHEFAQEVAHKIRILFSLLLGFQLSFENIWLNTDRAERIPFYFPCSGDKNDPFEHYLECTLLPQHLSNKKLWNPVLNNFFANKLFEQIWSRLPFMFSYKGAWEYELLGCISLLDACCSEFVDKSRKKLSKNKYKEIISDLLLVLDKHQVKLGCECSSILESFKATVSNIRNTNLPTFKEKFHALTETIEPEVLEMISLSEEQFDHVKSIRDKAAHGRTPRLFKEDDLNYEFIVRDKIKLLLTYLFYRDFGIDAVTFSSTLRETINKTVQNAYINKFARDKIIGGVPFYEVEKGDFDEVSNKNNGSLVIYHSTHKKTYSVNFELSQSIKNEWYDEKSKEYRCVVDFIKSKIDSYVSVEYVSRLYLICSDKNKEIYGACLITTE